ncbi:MAG: alanine--glyoxylate aminotransferase family protein, partial [Synergistaceae bacterium]|nr:alanine--glyoxylate aminotransferase family protein [Synergistaceae bacterium]
MESYRIGLIPGPVSVPEEIRKAWLNDYASSDLEDEFFALYRDNQTLTQELLHTKNDIVITSGEAMSILWAALKCTLKAGEKVLAVSSGLFGEGFAEMARAFGAEAEICAFPYDGIPEAEKVREHAKRYRPKVITAVHCETPSGTLTPCLEEIGRIAREVGAIFVVDFVSSVGGAELDVDACGIDIGLLGSQKVLSLTPCLSVSSISSRAWEVIADVNYSGYESYLGWKNVPAEHYMPYTHDWQAMKALNISLNMIMREGMEAAFKRHDMAARLCRD